MNILTNIVLSTLTSKVIKNFVSAACIVLLTAPATAQEDPAATIPGEPASPTTPDEPTSPAPNTPQSPFLFFDQPIAIDPESDIAPPPTTVLSPENDPAFMEREQAISRYIAEVEAIEVKSGGAWAGTLPERLLAMGILQQLQGNHHGAVQTFGRAVHVSRINSGLHAQDQIPAVEKLIESYIALGDWGNADQYYNYLYYVQERTYGINDPRIVPVMDSLADWNILAFNIGFGDLLGLRLTRAQGFYSAAARLVQDHFGKSDERFVELQQGIANTALLVARNASLMNEVTRPEYLNAQDMLRAQLHEHYRPQQPQGFVTGEQALKEIVDHYASEPEQQLEYATALADLADWYLLERRRRIAIESYEMAWTILGDLEDSTAQRQTLFGQVSPIPVFARYSDNLVETLPVNHESNVLHYDYVDLMFDVTRNGEVRNVRLLTEKTEANIHQLDRLQRTVRRSYFRPILVDGKPAAAANQHFRYRYWY
ncbi:MAG: hypothetical protein ACR2PR_02785 [Pseudohongiellaceae bacterium]